MNKNKWLLGEIDQWADSEIISNETASTLRGMYERKSQTGLLVIMFSIIGSLLIGAGIILIFAKNWDQFPIWLRVASAFAPLILAQILCCFVVMRKMQSIPWREGSAMFLSLSIFTVIAMVGRIFHLPGDFGTYVLTCGLLSLPAIYILNAVSPALIYFWTILNWAVLAGSYNIWDYTRFWLLGLLLLIAPFIFFYIKRDRYSVRSQILLWLCSIGGFVAIWTLNFILSEANIHYTMGAILLYFAMIYAIDALYFKENQYAVRPLKIVGGLGILVLLFTYSYAGVWRGWDSSSATLLDYIPYLIIAIAILGISIYCLIKIKNSSLETTMITSAIVAVISAILISTSKVSGMIPAAVVNLIIIAICIMIISRGVKEMQIMYMNLGMLIVCLLIILRFFDWGMDFLSRGIAFVTIGAVFLIANVYITKKRKAVSEK